MEKKRIDLSWEIEIGPGEKLMLSRELVDIVGPGRWLLTLSHLDEQQPGRIRDQRPFLQSYAPDDDAV